MAEGNKESKYKIIVKDVIQGIENKAYKQGDWIPSLNEFILKYNFSRDTVFAGIKELKARGIIESKPGIGYFISSTRIDQKRKIFLLFNEFNAFKEDLYNSFIERIGTKAIVEIFFHHYNRKVFTNLIREAKDKYTSYVIMPGKFVGIDKLLQSLKGDVYLLDHMQEKLKTRFPSVYQNFSKDMTEALEYAFGYVKKYKKIILIQKNEIEPYERYQGIMCFCKKHNLDLAKKDSFAEGKIQKGFLYIIINDRDLVNVVKQSMSQNLIIGKDFGIISCNEMPLKEIIAGGITTISTDFRLMGENMADMIINKRTQSIENPWKINIRSSF